MDRFLLKPTDYLSYEINSNNFDTYTNRNYSFVQASKNKEDRYYAVCPGCGNPILLVNLYKHQEKQRNPYGRHVKKIYHILLLIINKLIMIVHILIQIGMLMMDY